MQHIIIPTLVSVCVITFYSISPCIRLAQDIVGEHPQANVRWVAVIGPSIAIICIGLTLVLYLSNR